MSKIPVAILAATGSVGQRFVQLLDGHPWFEVVALTGSDRSIGRPYGEVCHWVLGELMPDWAKNMTVVPTEPGAVDAALVFSALPTDVAKTVEPLFAQAGKLVCSNASAYRKEPDVPILLPEINGDHAAACGCAAPKPRVERRDRDQSQLHQHRDDGGAQGPAGRLWLETGLGSFDAGYLGRGLPRGGLDGYSG